MPFSFSSSSTQVHSFCCCVISRNLLCFSRPSFTMTLYKKFVCITFLFLALTQFVLSGKQTDVRKCTTGTRASTVPEEDLTHRTLLQWQRQPLESLRFAPRQQPTNQSNSPTILARQQLPFRAPQIRSAPPSQPRLTCRCFNAGQCSSSYCQFPHHCRSCYGNHPQIHCPRRDTYKQ